MVKILSVCCIHTHNLVLHMGLNIDTDNCSGVQKEMVLDSSLWLEVSCQLL